MMQIIDNIKLAPYTTFKIGGPANHFVYAQTDEEIVAAAVHANERNLEMFVFGGGSNVLVSDRGFDGLAVRTETIGIDMVEDNPATVTLKIASGEIWDDVVRFAVEQNWFGIENLSHIPGFMGGFAVQNVGAYGQEASQVVTQVDAYDTQTQKIVSLSNAECEFGYRKSIFNTQEKQRYIILYTHIQLQKNGRVNLSYGELKKYFNDDAPSIQQVRNAVITIRDTKFPFPDKPTTGNAGSFFRGPILTQQEFNTLVDVIKTKFNAAAYEKITSMGDRLQVAQGYKTPTAFLIELCDLKGYQIGGAKVNEPQPAIMLNATGAATSKDVLDVYNHVAQTVYGKTGVQLHIEPELIGFNSVEISQLSGYSVD